MLRQDPLELIVDDSEPSTDTRPLPPLKIATLLLIHLLTSQLFSFGIVRDVRAQRQAIPFRVPAFQQETRKFYTTEDGLPANSIDRVSINERGQVAVSTSAGAAILRNKRWQSMRPEQLPPSANELPDQLAKGLSGDVTSFARHSDKLAVGTTTGLYIGTERELTQQYPAAQRKRWAPTRVHVDFSPDGTLWFASDQGVGRFDGKSWSLYTGAEGLPYDRLTCVACAPDGSVWFGTTIGAIRFDGERWAYRQGKRWLPHDEVHSIVVAENGSAWVATAGGLSHLTFQPMTLAEKAAIYESEIDKYHRRTEWGYVIEAACKSAGSKSDLTLRASDNDGLWTSMYGAGECFAYGATKNDAAKQRATAVFKALRFLSEAPIGCEHAPPKGFIARTVLETSFPNPNLGSYSLEGQKRKALGDGYWRIYEPRWPKSADGKYYWKSDTSSDELDGHYFFYSLYYDLVAETDAEKSAVRELVRANIDHLISHDFCLHDHAGRTRWAVYSPTEMNRNPEWHVERGINSISILSYLNVAFHMTGDEKYRAASARLRDEHGYHINAMWPKFQRGIGTGNQSDDEMAFMAYYNLIKYEPDAKLKQLYLASFANSWRLEEPEMNPFFNFCFAAVGLDATYSNIWGTHDLSPWPSWLSDSVETLMRFPLDRFDWRHTNRHRTDLIMLSDHAADAYDRTSKGRGYRVNGKVIPVDERYFNHWNHDPWRLDTGGSGNGLGCGSVFTLPYYMGLYHGFIAE